MPFAVICGYDNRYALSDLWGQAFGDDAQFVADMYDCGYLNSSDIFALTQDGRLIAALFLPEYRIRVNDKDLPIRLLSCVATDPSHQGRGHMSYLIPRALRSVHDECCGVCVIPVSKDLYKFYEKFGFETAFWISEQVFEIDGNEPQEALPFQAEDLDAHYDAYLRKYAKNGFVFKSKERFSQAVKEYLHPTQPCEFFLYSQGFAFLQKASSEILVREWTGDATRLASELSVRYRLSVRIQYPPRSEDKKPIGMLHSFSDSLSAFAKEHNLYLNCMYN